MKKVQALRRAIYNQFENSPAKQHFIRNENKDAYAAYYTSMFLIQDTAEAVHEHMARGFSPNPMMAYVEFWGVMQAIIIQQDSICELYTAVVGRKWTTARVSAWRELRDKRNLCAGHPANRSAGVPASQRTFMGRHFGNYDQITYELYDAHTKNVTHPTFDLRKMIDDYDTEAGHVLGRILSEIRKSWP